MASSRQRGRQRQGGRTMKRQRGRQMGRQVTRQRGRQRGRQMQGGVRTLRGGFGSSTKGYWR